MNLICFFFGHQEKKGCDDELYCSRCFKIKHYGDDF